MVHRGPRRASGEGAFEQLGGDARHVRVERDPENAEVGTEGEGDEAEQCCRWVVDTGVPVRLVGAKSQLTQLGPSASHIGEEGIVDPDFVVEVERHRAKVGKAKKGLECCAIQASAIGHAVDAYDDGGKGGMATELGAQLGDVFGVAVNAETRRDFETKIMEYRRGHEPENECAGKEETVL